MGNKTYLNRKIPLGNFRSSLSYEMASDNKAPFTHHQMSFNCWVIISRNEQMMFAISCEIDRPHPCTSSPGQVGACDFLLENGCCIN